MLLRASLLLLLCLLGHLGYAQQEDKCVRLTRNLEQRGRCPVNNKQQCRLLCSGIDISGQRNCSLVKHCCFVNQTCYLKELYRESPTTDQQLSATNVAQTFLDTAIGDGRLGSLGALSVENIQALFPHVLVSPRFPQSCAFALENLQPEINIPYCQRIACRADFTLLEENPNQCLSIPGCAYDFELSIYKGFLGQAILPGVPVCHLAIRNKVFHERVNSYLNQTSSLWNPLLAECLIEVYSDEIFGLAPECVAVQSLKKLGYQPKQAGWRSITERDCNLIDGCWLENSCVYPFNPLKLKTNRDFVHDFLDILPFLQGSPECLTFENVTKGGYLDAYHTCYKAGCAMKTDRSTLLQHLHGVATSYLPRFLQHQYWTMVLLGQVRADNWKQVADRLIAETANNEFLNRILPQAQNQLNTGSTPPGGVSVMPFALALNMSSGSIMQSPFLSFGTFGEFASSNAMATNTGDARTLPNNRRPNNNRRNFNLQNIGSSVNRSPASNAQPWANLQSLLSGIQPSAPKNEVDLEDEERNLEIVLPCFFQPIQWPNFPPLQGSFEDCCKRPLCFLPKAELQNAKSEIASYTTYWSTWAPCSVTCGGGTQTRRRFCIGDYCHDESEEVESQSCSSGQCPAAPITATYSQWSDYTSCSASCGNGRQTRTRQCLQPPPLCTERTTQTKRCRGRRCTTVRPESWSPCSTTCGEGTQRRRVICASSDRSLCPTTNFEERRCRQTCGRIQRQFTCDTTSCFSVLTQRCLQDSGQPGYCGPNFQSNSRTSPRRCYEGRCCNFHKPRNRQVCYRTG